MLEETPQKLGYFKNPYLLCPPKFRPTPKYGSDTHQVPSLLSAWVYHSSEEFGLAITDSLAILDEVKEKINNIPAPKGKVFQEKLEQVLGKNSSLYMLPEVAMVQFGISDSMVAG